MQATNDSMEQFIAVLEHFDEAMLVTRRGDELRSRPMAVADYTADGRIRFITRDDSGKLAELDEYSAVNVACQGSTRYLSISGRARLTKDRRLIEKCWQKKQSPWFRDGCDDPHVILLEVIPTYVEYWDRSETNFIKLIFAENRDVRLDDADADDDIGKHGKVDFAGTPLGQRVRE
jgi:general stress protein 26